MTFKQMLIRYLFCIEVIVVVGFFLFGPQGVIAARELQRSLHDQQKSVIALQQELADLENECKEWRENPFYTEKHAREKLSMAREGEQIYLIS